MRILRYSDGLYILKITGVISENEDKYDYLLNTIWERCEDIDTFECFHIYWGKFSESGGLVEYHNSTLWISTEMNLIVVFIANYHLLQQIIDRLRSKFQYDIEKIFPKLKEEGVRVAFSQTGLISTELLSNNLERLNLIKSLSY